MKSIHAIGELLVLRVGRAVVEGELYRREATVREGARRFASRLTSDEARVAPRISNGPRNGQRLRKVTVVRGYERSRCFAVMKGYDGSHPKATIRTRNRWAKS